MSKIEDLEKKLKRVSSEAEKAENQVKKYQEIAKNKHSEAKKIEMEIIAETLVKNDMTLEDFKKLVAHEPSVTSTPSFQSQANQQNLGE